MCCDSTVGVNVCMRAGYVLTKERVARTTMHISRTWKNKILGKSSRTASHVLPKAATLQNGVQSAPGGATRPFSCSSCTIIDKFSTASASQNAYKTYFQRHPSMQSPTTSKICTHACQKNLNHKHVAEFFKLIEHRAIVNDKLKATQLFLTTPLFSAPRVFCSVRSTHLTEQ